jgi:hypothetical protein
MKISKCQLIIRSAGGIQGVAIMDVIEYWGLFSLTQNGCGVTREQLVLSIEQAVLVRV